MKASKITLWILLGSMALNVFLAIVIGKHMAIPPFPPPRPTRIIEEIADKLPKADAQILRDSLNAHEAELKEEDHGPEVFHKKMRDVLTAPQFDPEAFRAVADEFQARRERIGSTLTRVMLDALPKMSPEGRQAVADFKPPPPPPRP